MRGTGRIYGTAISPAWRWVVAAAASAGAVSASVPDEATEFSSTSSLNSQRLRRALLAPITAMAEAPDRDEGSPRSSASTPSLSEEERLQRFTAWLKERGAKLDKVNICRSQEENAGLGLYSKVQQRQRDAGAPPWWASRWAPWTYLGLGAAARPPHFVPLAEFPLSSALTAENIMQAASRRESYAWMLEHGVVDERTIVLAHLVVERLAGQKSELAPYIDILPQSFDTPLHWTSEELGELSGTTLLRAATAVARLLQSQWDNMLPALHVAAREGGSGSRVDPTFSDYLWAYSIYWSRGQALPMSTGNKAAAALGASVSVQEGLVPGLDLCNHRDGAGGTASAQCWWDVHAAAAPAAAGSAPDASGVSFSGTVQLKLHSGQRVKPGEELFISYGDKGNEELLMLYGFATVDNPNERLMLHCPVPPPSQWDDTMRARMQLLQAYDLKPQFFLSAAALRDQAGGTRLAIPSEALSVLEVFILEPHEVALALADARRAASIVATAAAGGHAGAGGSLSGGAAATRGPAQALAVAGRKPASAAATASAAEGAMAVLDVGVGHDPKQVSAVLDRRLLMSRQELGRHIGGLGLRMGALSALVRLLEVRLLELEGVKEGGTGPLEDDLRLLQAAQGTMPHRQWSAIVYRSGQKQLVRAYLVRARRELSEVMRAISELTTARAGAQEA